MRFKIINFANIFFKTHLKISEVVKNQSGRGKILIFTARNRKKLIHDFFNHVNYIL